MPIFRYRAHDASGSVVEGDIHASDTNDAIRQLGIAGKRVLSVSSMPSSATPHPARQPSSQSAPATRPRIAIPAPVTTDAPTAGPGVVRTGIASMSERMFVFSQLDGLLRSGINPHDACIAISNRTRNDDMASAFRHLAQGAAEGRGMAKMMDLYPDLFPPGVVGMVAAGEAGGFLPDACRSISEQQKESHRFARFFWWVWVLIANLFLSIPLVIALVVGLRKLWDSFDDTTASPVNAFLGGIGSTLIGPVGWMFAFFCALFYSARWMFRSTAKRPLRHSFAAWAPTLKKRTLGECLAAFSWTLSRLAAAGISPRESWRLAALAVPNIAMSDRLVQVGSRLHESSRLSEAFYADDMFPREYASIVENGEFIGDAPGALQQVAESSTSEYQTTESMTKARAGCWGVIVVMVTSALLAALLFRGFYDYVFQKLASE